MLRKKAPSIMGRKHLFAASAFNIQTHARICLEQLFQGHHIATLVIYLYATTTKLWNRSPWQFQITSHFSRRKFTTSHHTCQRNALKYPPYICGQGKRPTAQGWVGLKRFKPKLGPTQANIATRHAERRYLCCRLCPFEFGRII